MSGPGECESIERWRPAVGWEGFYEVSDRGQVRSVERTITYRDGRSYVTPGQPIQPQVKDSGHLHVRLSREGVGRTVYVHTLVAEAFIGPRPPGREVRHRNGKHDDNWWTNLRYGTRAENVRDAVEHGTHPWSGRPVCSRGHRLEGANLRLRHRAARPPNRQATTTRVCEACKWAQNKARCAGPSFDLAAAADERYREITAA